MHHHQEIEKNMSSIIIAKNTIKRETKYQKLFKDEWRLYWQVFAHHSFLEGSNEKFAKILMKVSQKGLLYITFHKHFIHKRRKVKRYNNLTVNFTAIKNYFC